MHIFQQFILSEVKRFRVAHIPEIRCLLSLLGISDTGNHLLSHVSVCLNLLHCLNRYVQLSVALEKTNRCVMIVNNW